MRTKPLIIVINMYLTTEFPKYLRNQNRTRCTECPAAIRAPEFHARPSLRSFTVQRFTLTLSMSSLMQLQLTTSSVLPSSCSATSYFAFSSFSFSSSAAPMPPATKHHIIRRPISISRLLRIPKC